MQCRQNSRRVHLEQRAERRRTSTTWRAAGSAVVRLDRPGLRTAALVEGEVMKRRQRPRRIDLENRAVASRSAADRRAIEAAVACLDQPGIWIAALVVGE